MPKTRVLLAGCGSICNAWLKAVKDRDDVEIVGLMDISAAAMAKLAATFGMEDVPRYTDLAAALDDLNPEAVFDCAIPEAHVDITIQALEHGCHVLGEKPLAATLADARTMVDTARRCKRVFAVIQNRRYQAAIRGVRRFIASGAIGRVTTVNSDFYIGAHFGGFRDRMRHVLLLDMAIHTFDQARFLAGADPRQVYCREWNPADSWYDHDASAQCIFAMTDGIVYSYRGSWCSEGVNTTWECDWRIIGTKGSLVWDGGDTVRAETVTGGGGFRSAVTPCAVPLEMPPGMEAGHKGVICEFLDCIRGGAVPETAAADNIKSLAMVFGAIDSAETGAVVTIDA